jgi:hypothetical protein
MPGFPSFAQDERSHSKSRDRVGPRFVPDGVYHESRESNPPMQPQKDSSASAFRAPLDVTTANFRFQLASQGIIAAAASRIPIPTRLRCASRYPKKLKTEVRTTKRANAKSKLPATRAARASPNVHLRLLHRQEWTLGVRRFALPSLARHQRLQESHSHRRFGTP